LYCFVSAEQLGFDSFITEFGVGGFTHFLDGVNYGSSGAGILDETGYLSVIINDHTHASIESSCWLKKLLELFCMVLEKLCLFVGNRKLNKTYFLIENIIFFFSRKCWFSISFYRKMKNIEKGYFPNHNTYRIRARLVHQIFYVRYFYYFFFNISQTSSYFLIFS
jgi:hypothetical protein